MLTCVALIATQAWFNVTKEAVVVQAVPVPLELPGIVRSEPVLAELKSVSSGRLVPVVASDGASVKAGDVLARIEPEDQNLDIEALRLELLSHVMQKAAISAERQGSATLPAGDDIVPDANWSSDTTALFEELAASHREAVEKQLHVAHLKQEAERRQQDRLARKSSMVTAIRNKCLEQLSSLQAQRQRVAELVARGVFPKNRDAELERQVMAVEQRLVEADVQQAEIDAEIDAANLASAEQERSRFEDLLVRERDLAVKIADLKARIAARKDLAVRSEIHAPYDGVVRNVRFTMPGVKVGTGDVLMDIEKEGQSFVVEVVAPAADLPSVEAGDSAEVRTKGRLASKAPAIRATVEGVVSDAPEDAAGAPAPANASNAGAAMRTVYLAIDHDSVPVPLRQKFKPGYSVSVTVNNGAVRKAAEAGHAAVPPVWTWTGKG